MGGRLDMLADAVVEGSGSTTAFDALMVHVGTVGAHYIDQIRVPVVQFLLELVDVDHSVEEVPNSKGKPAPAGKTITRAEFYDQLFQFATGNLGWTPDQAWNASPAEIVAARKGRRDLLVSIFGTGEKQKPVPQGTLAEQAAATMAALGGRKVKG